MENHEKEVYYNQYCSTCIHNTSLDADGFPVQTCEECQATPMNIDSHKPVNYKEA